MFATVVIGDRQHNKLEASDEDFYRTLRTYNKHLSRIKVMMYVTTACTIFCAPRNDNVCR
jgi:hypothetical protein